MTKRSKSVCVNCEHGSLVRSNFKFTSEGKAYCVKKCIINYEANDRNFYGARQKGDKVE